MEANYDFSDMHNNKHISWGKLPNIYEKYGHGLKMTIYILIRQNMREREK
jgi:hypothetical protein